MEYNFDKLNGEIRLAYINHGAVMLVGQFESVDGGYKITKPVHLSFTSSNIAMIPLLGISIEDSVLIPLEDIAFGQVFCLVPEVYNHYQSQFGSGIQLVS